MNYIIQLQQKETGFWEDWQSGFRTLDDAMNEYRKKKRENPGCFFRLILIMDDEDF